MISRTDRQKEGIKKWINSNCRGTWCYGTGVGKSFASVMVIKKVLKVKPDAKILISVPSEFLQKQWMNNYIIKYNLIKNCEVRIINSIIKSTHEVDLLIIDEAHLVASNMFSQIFNCVDYDMILCLTATLERLDGKEVIIKQNAPVCDIITIQEATNNGWLSPYKEYVVLLDVDLTEYKNWNKEFINYFSYFDFNFSLAMRLCTDIIARRKYAKKMNIDSKKLDGICFAWMSFLRKRKNFVQSHPHKLEIARKILDARSDKKCITFCSTIKDSEKLAKKGEYVLHSGKSKKSNEQTINEFNKLNSGVLHSSKAARTGIDLKGLSVEIILNTDSSKITKTQTIGRTIRFEQGKQAEVFTLIIKDSVEQKWFANSSSSSYTLINEQQLDEILNNNPIEVRDRILVKDINYRY